MKNFWLLAITMLSLFSCSQDQAVSNEKLIRQYFGHFNKHDWKSLANLYADTASFKDPSLGLGVFRQARGQIVKKYEGLSQNFPDVSDQIISIYPSGNDHVIVEFVSTGTAPDGSKFELPICTVFEIQNGKITQDFTYYDNFGE